MRTNYYPRCDAALDVTFDGRRGPDAEGVLVHVKPTEARVQFNGYQDADTWDMRFDGRQLPFDPDLFRGGAVEIYMYEARNLDEVTDWRSPPDVTLLGIIDDVKFSSGMNGMSVEMSGKDYTTIIHEREWDTRERIPTGRPMSDTLAVLLREALGGSTVMSVDYRAPYDPTVGHTQRSTKKKGMPVKPGKSYWDVIYGLCVAHGLLVFVDGIKVVVTDPDTFFEEAGSNIPVAVHGHNIRELSVERKLVKEMTPQITSSLRDPRTGEVTKVIYPQDAVAPPTTGIGTQKDSIISVLPPSHITSVEALREYVKSQYEMRARGESRYSFATKHLADLEGNSFMSLRAGMPVFIKFDAFDKGTLRELPVPKRVEHLIAMNYSEQVATVVANGLDALQQFEQPYYTESVEIAFSNSTGLDIEVNAMNYAYERRNKDATSDGVKQEAS